MPKNKENPTAKLLQNLTEYNFPAYGVTILASDIRDAEEKLQLVINNPL